MKITNWCIIKMSNDSNLQNDIDVSYNEQSIYTKKKYLKWISITHDERLKLQNSEIVSKAWLVYKN